MPQLQSAELLRWRSQGKCAFADQLQSKEAGFFRKPQVRARPWKPRQRRHSATAPDCESFQAAQLWPALLLSAPKWERQAAVPELGVRTRPRVEANRVLLTAQSWCGTQ